MSHSTVTKDPADVRPLQLDWSAWLTGEGSDTIASAAWTVSGVTLDSDTNTTTATTAWLSGGTAGTTATAACAITTAAGRVKEWTVSIIIEEQ